MTFPHRVIRMCIFQQPVYIHLIQDLLLTTKKSNNQIPIHISAFSQDQSRRLGLGPTHAVSLSLDKIHYNFLQRTFTFQLLDELWSQVSSLLPPGTCLQFLSRIGFSIPTARRLSSNVANSRFRAFRESICAQEKVPTNLYEYALGGDSNSRN